MNKIATKYRLAHTQDHCKSKKQLLKKNTTCRCPVSPSTAKKSKQGKIAMPNSTKLKKVVSNIRNMCGDTYLENVTKDLTNKASTESVIYVGTTYPNQADYPIIDLTSSNTSLQQSRSSCYSLNTTCSQSQLRTVKMPRYLRYPPMCKSHRLSKSTSVLTLPVRKMFGRTCTVSNSSILLPCNTKVLRDISVLDLPYKYASNDGLNDAYVEQATKLNSIDHEIMDMVLDMEDEYNLLFSSGGRSRFFKSGCDMTEIMNTYYKE